MLSVETGKNPIPMLRIDAIVALAQFRQISLSINDKSTRFITTIRSLQDETIGLSAVMHQLSANELRAVPFDQLVNMRTTAS